MSKILISNKTTGEYEIYNQQEIMGNLYTTTSKAGYAQPVHNWYYEKYNVLPSEFYLKKRINIKKVLKQFEDKIVSASYSENEEGKVELISFYLLLDEEKKIVLYSVISPSKSKDKNAEIEYVSTIFFNTSDTKIEDVEKHVNKLSFIKELKQKETTLNLLSRDSFVGYHLKPMKVDFKNINIDLNYNDDLKEVDKIILKGLRDVKSRNKGLTVLYGPPGTGKTTYIRSLAKRVKNKKFVLVPTNLIANLTEPTFLDFLSKMENLVLITEESEQALVKRDIKDNSSISNILNMSDGLLGDCINFKIIATFNTELKNIDEALLRKGRLLAKYEFKELSEEKAKILKSKIGAENIKSNLLSEIYNPEDTSFESEKEKIGFKNYSAEIETKS